MTTVAIATCDCGHRAVSRTPALAEHGLRQHSCEQTRIRRERAARVAARRTAEGERRDCTHPVARHTHGTHAAYVLDRCRCRPCRDATRDYENARVRDRLYGRDAYTDATPARDHIRGLMANGVGLKRIAAISGVSNGALTKLVYGVNGRPPSRRIRPDTATKILAVTEDHRATGANVDAYDTWQRIHALIALGYTRTWIAAQIGQRGPLQLGEFLVTERHARAIRDLYERVGDTPAFDSPGAARSRNEAARNGWLRPIDLDLDPRRGEEGDSEPVDEVAVERACAGDLVTLTTDEKRAAVRLLAARGLGSGDIARRLRLSGDTTRRLLAETAAIGGAA